MAASLQQEGAVVGYRRGAARSSGDDDRPRHHAGHAQELDVGLGATKKREWEGGNSMQRLCPIRIVSPRRIASA